MANKIKEKAPVRKELKEKVKAAPKELLRRGLSDGTQRLRGQLRDTAQQGQRDRNGGDQIEDAAWAGGHWGKRGIQKLLKQKRDSGGRRTGHSSPLPPETPVDSLPWEEPASPDPPGSPVTHGGTERVRIKTREAVPQTSSRSASPKFKSQDGTFQPYLGTSPLPIEEAAPSALSAPKETSERMRIKTKEAVSQARSRSASPKFKPQDGIFQPYFGTSAPPMEEAAPSAPSAPKGYPERVRIKTREVVSQIDPVEIPGVEDESIRSQSRIIRPRSAVPAQRTDLSVPFEPPAPKERPKHMQIRTREAFAERRFDAAIPGKRLLDLPLQDRRRIRTQAGGSVPEDMPLPDLVPTPRREWPTVKTKNAYIQQRASTTIEQPPQALEQGRELFHRKRAQKQAEDRIKRQQSAPEIFPVPQADQNDSPVPRPAVGQRPVQKKETSSFAIPRAGSSTKSEPIPEGKMAVKASHPNVIAHKNEKIIGRPAGRSVKNAEHTSTQVIKARGHGNKVIQQTAQAVPQAHRGAVQAVRTTKKAAAVTRRSAAKAGTAALRAAVRALRDLMAALTAGGGVVISVVLVVCLVGLIVASPFGIFFLDGSGDPDAVSPAAAVALIDQEYEDTLASLEAEGSYDSVEVVGGPPSWSDVFAVFAVKTTTGDALNVAVLDADRMERLRAVFWDMTKITTAVSTVDHPATDDTDAWTETVLTITVTPRTPDDMRVFYTFTDEQNAALDELLTAENGELWNSLFYGGSGEIVSVALSQLGNVGGQPYWSWYGFSSRVSWCACFVSWCANECGYIDAGVIPKFSSCSSGVSWFKHRGLWQDKDYEPHPGDIIFFDWDNKGVSGPQNGSPDHVGIVERVENGTVYTVEGNSSDRCRQRSYSVGHYEIYGYGTLIVN